MQSEVSAASVVDGGLRNVLLRADAPDHRRTEVLVSRCTCGHILTEHLSSRGRCTRSVRIWLKHPGDDVLRTSPGVVLSMDEANVVIEEAFGKLDKAPSYEKQVRKLGKRGYLFVDCQCQFYRTLPIPGE